MTGIAGDQLQSASAGGGVLHEHPGWSVFWEKRQCVWRAAEDDPGSDLYTESPDLDAVIAYITGHS